MAEVLTISALNQYAKSVLDQDPLLRFVALKGEVTNFVHHYKSGHFYFSLRDESASVKAVMFRGDASRLAFRPEEGMRVIVRCRVSLYEATGSFQIYVSDMFPDGLGAAQMAFEQLRKRLEAEGLFRQEYKQPIPTTPRRIGVVTSATGAALQDIRNVLQRRWPLAKLVLAPVNVQGDKASREIAAGIRTLDSMGQVDVILVARGGGSREDLWVFNDEQIARAAFACKTPLVSAVGHEIDVSILDFVADLRAPTPSAAAELVTPDGAMVLQKLADISMNIQINMQERLHMCYNKLNEQFAQREQCSPEWICGTRQERVMRLAQNLQKVVQVRMNHHSQTVGHMAALSYSLSPYAVLARGYGLIMDDKGKYFTVDSVCEGDEFVLKGQKKQIRCLALKEEQHEELI